jgi:hypothetical protein
MPDVEIKTVRRNTMPKDDNKELTAGILDKIAESKVTMYQHKENNMLSDFLKSQKFYELCQRYRLAPFEDPLYIVSCFEDMQKAILEHAEVRAEQPASEPTVDEAIAVLVRALQRSKGWLHDYADAIIRDAIDRKPASEPVAWQCRQHGLNAIEWDDWKTLGYKPQGPEGPHFQMRPLYLAPPIQPQPSEDAKDAARLDWLQHEARCDPKMDGQHVWWPLSWNQCQRIKGPTIRDAIDAAMAQKGQP